MKIIQEIKEKAYVQDLECFLLLMECLHLKYTNSKEISKEELQDRIDQLFFRIKDQCVQIQEVRPKLKDWKFRSEKGHLLIGGTKVRELQSYAKNLCKRVGPIEPIEQLLKAKEYGKLKNILFSYYDTDEKAAVLKKIIMSSHRNNQILFEYFEAIASSFTQKQQVELRNALKDDFELRMFLFRSIVGKVEEEESIALFDTLLKLNLLDPTLWNLNNQEYTFSSLAFCTDHPKIGMYFYQREEYLDYDAKEKRDFQILEHIGYNASILLPLLEEKSFIITREKLEFLEPILYYGIENKTLERKNLDKILEIFIRRARTEDKDAITSFAESIQAQVPDTLVGYYMTRKKTF